jgi:hypothetical protein
MTNQVQRFKKIIAMVPKPIDYEVLRYSQNFIG